MVGKPRDVAEPGEAGEAAIEVRDLRMRYGTHDVLKGVDFVRELLAHFASYYREYREPWDTDELITAVGLTEHARKRADRLSGGQRRRLDVRSASWDVRTCCALPG